MRSGVYITCSLLLLSGCAHGNWRQSVASSWSRDSTTTASIERIKTVEKLLDDAPAPRSSVLLLRAQNQDHPTVALTSGSAGNTAVISHDAATLAIIERETRDFSSADRDRAVAALKAIPSESVPAVLQLWKAGLISPLAHPTSPVILAPATAADLPVATNFASYEEPQVDVGLGQKSPWQNQTVRHADYESHDGSRQPALGNKVVQASQITRVSRPVVGYSSPFAGAPDAINQMGGGPNFEQQPAMSFPSHRNSGYHPVMPPDWQSVSGDWSSHRSSTGGRSQAFSTDSGRHLVTPADWQPSSVQPSAPHAASQISPRAFNSVPESHRPASPTALDGPVIRPQPRGSEVEQAPPLRPAIGRMGFTQAVPETISPEIALAPGQMLPGFEHLAENNPLRLPILAGQLPSPTGSNMQHGTQVSGIGSDAARVQSSGAALQLLIRATEAEVAQLVPGQTAEELQYYIERQVYLRLLYLMSGQTETALRPIPSIPAVDQEFWTQVLWGVNNYFDLPRVPNHAERAAQTISQFNTAMLRLKERAPLELKNATFCHKIDGYGEYDTYSKDEFTPGQRVLVYAEIDNFHSELSTEGIYRTRLKSTLEFVSAEAPQEPVEVKVYPVTEDFCRNHRRDYFHSYVVEIPVRCVRGSHALKLIIEDELSGKTGTYSIPFVVR